MHETLGIKRSTYTFSEPYLSKAFSLDVAVDVAQRRLRENGIPGALMVIYRDEKPLIMARYRVGDLKDPRNRVELMMYPHWG